jgi:hypothetical protein
MGGSISPISAALQRMQQQNAPQPGQGVGYQAPAPANVYRQQQSPYRISPFVQQQMQMQRMQQMQQMQPEVRGLGQQDYVSPLQSMLSNVLYGYNPQQFNQQPNPQQFDLQAMMQQAMPSYSGPAYRPDMAQVQQNLSRVSAPYIPPPPPAPEPAPEATAGGGGE